MGNNKSQEIIDEKPLLSSCQGTSVDTSTELSEDLSNEKSEQLIESGDALPIDFHFNLPLYRSCTNESSARTNNTPNNSTEHENQSQYSKKEKENENNEKAKLCQETFSEQLSSLPSIQCSSAGPAHSEATSCFSTDEKVQPSNNADEDANCLSNLGLTVKTREVPTISPTASHCQVSKAVPLESEEPPQPSLVSNAVTSEGSAINRAVSDITKTKESDVTEVMPVKGKFRKLLTYINANSEDNRVRYNVEKNTQDDDNEGHSRKTRIPCYSNIIFFPDKSKGATPKRYGPKRLGTCASYNEGNKHSDEESLDTGELEVVPEQLTKDYVDEQLQHSEVIRAKSVTEVNKVNDDTSFQFFDNHFDSDSETSICGQDKEDSSMFGPNSRDSIISYNESHTVSCDVDGEHVSSSKMCIDEQEHPETWDIESLDQNATYPSLLDERHGEYLQGDKTLVDVEAKEDHSKTKVPGCNNCNSETNNICSFLNLQTRNLSCLRVSKDEQKAVFPQTSMFFPMDIPWSHLKSSQGRYAGKLCSIKTNIAQDNRMSLMFNLPCYTYLQEHVWDIDSPVSTNELTWSFCANDFEKDDHDTNEKSLCHSQRVIEMQKMNVPLSKCSVNENTVENVPPEVRTDQNSICHLDSEIEVNPAEESVQHICEMSTHPKLKVVQLVSEQNLKLKCKKTLLKEDNRNALIETVIDDDLMAEEDEENEWNVPESSGRVEAEMPEHSSSSSSMPESPGSLLSDCLNFVLDDEDLPFSTFRHKLMLERQRRAIIGRTDASGTEGNDEDFVDNAWNQVLTEEIEKCCRQIQLLGVTETHCTILLVDISQSMTGQPFEEVRHSLQMFITGLKQEVEADQNITEHVALVTCGTETRIVVQPTTDYQTLLDACDRMVPSDMTPLLPALQISVMVTSCMHEIQRKVHGIRMKPRIIMLSDGYPTPVRMVGCEDQKDQEYCQEFVNQVENLEDVEDIEFYFIPCGRHQNKDFFERLSAVTKGRVIEADDILTLAGNTRNYLRAAQIARRMLGKKLDLHLIRTLTLALYPGISLTDQNEILKIIETANEERERNKIKTSTGTFQSVIAGDETDEDDTVEGDMNTGEHKDLLQIGKRVVKDPASKDDGRYLCNTGTVIGHQSDDQLIVNWDSSFPMLANYKQGTRNKRGEIDVIEDERPRPATVEDSIKIGHAVRRGPDWQFGDQDGGFDNVGIVCGIDSGCHVTVSWPNGVRNIYRYNDNGVYDILISDPNDPHGTNAFTKDMNKRNIFITDNREPNIAFEDDFEVSDGIQVNRNRNKNT